MLATTYLTAQAVQKLRRRHGDVPELRERPQEIRGVRQLRDRVQVPILSSKHTDLNGGINKGKIGCSRNLMSPRTAYDRMAIRCANGCTTASIVLWAIAQHSAPLDVP